MNLTPIEINLINTEKLTEQVTWNSHKENQRQGADIATLYVDGDKSIALVRFHPGASAKPHLHNGFETIYVISGAYTDNSGTHIEGDLVIYPDQSIHSWKSETGALLYVVWGGSTLLVN